MNFKAELLREHSKANAVRIINYIGTDVDLFDELMSLFLGNEYRITQHSAWVVTYCVENNPFLIEKYWPTLLEKIQDPTAHEAIRRNTIRMWQFISIPEQYEGAVIDFCYKCLNDSNIAAATKAFSITVLEKLCQKYPELTPEIGIIIQQRLPYELPSFKSRGLKFLKKFGLK